MDMKTTKGDGRRADTARREVFTHLASCLEYPSHAVIEAAGAALPFTGRKSAAASRHFAHFRDFVASTPMGTLQEIYTDLFDLQPECCLYVGYHVFGDTPRRGIFMANLVGWYRASGFAADGHDLPDFLPTILRFLPHAAASEEKEELARYCLIPAVQRIERGLRSRAGRYRHLLASVRLALQDDNRKGGS